VNLSQEVLASLNLLCYYLTHVDVIAKHEGREGNMSLRISGSILGYETGCLPMPVSCTLNEMHVSEVLGCSSVSASNVEEEFERRFSKIFFEIA
jgi:hypothetical protein